jgi:hypothetical protein
LEAPLNGAAAPPPPPGSSPRVAWSPPRGDCLDRRQGGRSFGDMVDRFTIVAERLLLSLLMINTRSRKSTTRVANQLAGNPISLLVRRMPLDAGDRLGRAQLAGYRRDRSPRDIIARFRSPALEPSGPFAAGHARIRRLRSSGAFSYRERAPGQSETGRAGSRSEGGPAVAVQEADDWMGTADRATEMELGDITPPPPGPPAASPARA